MNKNEQLSKVSNLVFDLRTEIEILSYQRLLIEMVDEQIEVLYADTPPEHKRGLDKISYLLSIYRKEFPTARFDAMMDSSGEVLDIIREVQEKSLC